MLLFSINLMMMGRGTLVVVLIAMSMVMMVTAGSVWSRDQMTAESIMTRRSRDQCTMMGVAAKASADGSTMATHTNDCFDCDFRVALVKGKLHAPGEKRPVAPARFQYPRYIGLDRGETYFPENVADKQVYPWEPTSAIEYIPQVEKTYNFLDGSYALINENQVGFGESTCSAKLVNVPKHDGGNATFDLSELSRIALARSRTAREAIQIIGDLAFEYGFYGTEWKGPGMYGEAGEALMVTDPHEAWVFHILPDGTDNSAVWAAQRIPDGHMAVCANEFIIGDMDLDDHKNFMYSSNIVDVAVQHKFYDPKSGAFNFRKAYSQPEFHVHHSYSDRRNWRVFDLVAPSRKFPSNSSLDTLPFSVKPDIPLSHHDLMRIQRDHYEGTEFDLTRGLAGGSHGNPNRYDGGWASGVPIEWLVEGNFERAISIHRTNYAIVTQSRAWLPNEIGGMVWFGAAQPHATCFVPFYAGATHVAKSYQQGSLWKFRRDSAWWAFAAVGNWMEKNYKYMSEDVSLAQRRTESEISDARSGVETEAAQLIRGGRVLEGRAKISAWAERVAEQTASDWWTLFETLITRYLNGARIDDWHAKTFAPTSLFYPLEWLKAVDYWPTDMDFSLPGAKPVHVRDLTPSSPAVIATAPAAAAASAAVPAASATAATVATPSAAISPKKHHKETPTMSAAATTDLPVVPSSSSSSGITWSTVMGAMVVFAAGLAVGRLWQKRTDDGYVSVAASE